MKIKTFLSVGRLALLTLICVFTLCLAACGGDDDDSVNQPKEPSVDELLSEETTSITFRLESKGTHFLFDYAGIHLVGADTIEVEDSYDKSHKMNLRQGKHRLLWMRGLSGATVRGVNYKTKVKGIDYNPTADILTIQDNITSFYPELLYCIKEVEITPYLMAEQQIDYQPICAGFSIALDSPSSDYLVVLKNIPFVTAVGLENNKHEMTLYQTNIGFGLERNEYRAGFGREVLCPKEGLDNVRLEYEVIRFEGASQVSIHKCQLPKISLRRGYEVRVSGSLFGSKEDDFVVTTSKYSDSYGKYY